MTLVRGVAVLTVLVPVLALAWVLGCVLQLSAAVSHVLTRWAVGDDADSGV
jgi:hypothetical protein